MDDSLWMMTVISVDDDGNSRFSICVFGRSSDPFHYLHLWSFDEHININDYSHSIVIVLNMYSMNRYSSGLFFSWGISVSIIDCLKWLRERWMANSNVGGCLSEKASPCGLRCRLCAVDDEKDDVDCVIILWIEWIVILLHKGDLCFGVAGWRVKATWTSDDKRQAISLKWWVVCGKSLAKKQQSSDEAMDLLQPSVAFIIAGGRDPQGVPVFNVVIPKSVDSSSSMNLPQRSFQCAFNRPSATRTSLDDLANVRLSTFASIWVLWRVLLCPVALHHSRMDEYLCSSQSSRNSHCSTVHRMFQSKMNIISVLSEDLSRLDYFCSLLVLCVCAIHSVYSPWTLFRSQHLLKHSPKSQLNPASFECS